MKQSVPLFEGMYFNPDKRLVRHNLRYNDLLHFNVNELGESVLGRNLELNKKIARYYNVKPKNITVIQGGCSNANFHVFYTLLTPFEESRILVEDPSYEPLFCVPKRFNAEVVRFKRRWEDKFQPHLEEILDKIDNKTKAIVMTNTHYLSGVKLKKSILTKLIREAKKRKFYLFFDETYHDPFEAKEIRPVASLTKYGISSYSLSKMYGLSTLRFGLVVANEEFSKELTRAVFTTQVNSSGLLNKKWKEFFENINFHVKRSKKIRETNFSLLKEFFDKKGIEYIEPDSGTSCVFKIENIKAPIFYDYCINKFKLKIGHQEQFGDVMYIAFGDEPEKFRESLKVFGRALDSYKGKHF